jgi:uncharacterized cupredoxin-like copper-binding protein
MTLCPVFARRLMAWAALCLSGAAFAAGNHAGGHGHSAGASAIGKPGVPAKVTRTIAIQMSDAMRYTPSDIQVKQGETVRFVIQNQGQVRHELSLGTEKELLEHLALMKKFPDMEHDEPSQVTVAPGQQGEIVWQFTQAGTVNFACLMPGHYEAGMKGAVRVSRK